MSPCQGYSIRPAKSAVTLVLGGVINDICRAPAGALQISFGGFDGRGPDGSEFYNALHKLKGGSQWIEVCRHNRKAGFPMAKYGAMMVAYGDNLAVFGGYGIPHRPIQPGSSFESFVDGEGWTNEFHIYNVKEGKYTCTCSPGSHKMKGSDYNLNMNLY